MNTNILHDLECAFNLNLRIAFDSPEIEKITIKNLYQCLGIAQSAFWLEVISVADYITICQCLEGCISRIMEVHNDY